MPERTRIKITALEQRLAQSRQTIWRNYSAGNFPAPHYLGRDRVWYLDEIEAWEQEHVSQASAYRVGVA